MDQTARTVPANIIGFCLNHCPLIHNIVISTNSVIEFKVIQVRCEDDNDGDSVSYFVDEPGISSDSNNGSLVNVSMKNIYFTQEALDTLYGYLPNVKILITSKSPYHRDDQQVYTYDSNTTSLDFLKFSKLKKFALGITHYMRNDKNSCIFTIHLVYGNEEEGRKEEVYYKLAITKRFSEDYTFDPTTFNTIQQQEKDSYYLIKMHFIVKLEDLLITDYIEGDGTIVYGRLKDDELQPKKRRYSNEHLKWLSTNPFITHSSDAF